MREIERCSRRFGTPALYSGIACSISIYGLTTLTEAFCSFQRHQKNAGLFL
jgi:hypothetical protein